MEAATPMKPKKGAEVGQRSEMAASNTVDSIWYGKLKSTEIMQKGKRGNEWTGVGFASRLRQSPLNTSLNWVADRGEDRLPTD